MLWKESQIKQALEAVQKQPGSPAYALLAEYYLEHQQHAEALKICEIGFAANPSFERGAVAYLSVLKETKDLATASEVFGRAVAYLPRSARLRLVWASILADVGQEREARHLAREAQDLEPWNQTVKAFLTELEGRQKPIQDSLPYAHLNHISDVIPEVVLNPEGSVNSAPSVLKTVVPDVPLLKVTEPSSPSSAIYSIKAEVKPRVRPIGQRVTPHTRFDLTPAHGVPTLPVVPSPPSSLALPSTSGNQPNLPNLSEPDTSLLNIPSPSPTNESSEHLRINVKAPSSKVPPPPHQQLRNIGSSIEQSSNTQAPFDVAIPESSTEKTSALANLFEMESKAKDQVSGIHNPSRQDTHPSPKRLHQLHPTDVIQFRKPRWHWPLLISVIVVGSLLGGFFMLRYLQSRAIQKGIAVTLAKMSTDQLDAYLQSHKELTHLYHAHPQDIHLVGALALVKAHLGVRLLDDEKYRREARDLIDHSHRLIQQKPSSQVEVAWIPTATALLHLRAGKIKEAQRALMNVPQAKRDWHFYLTMMMVDAYLGQTKQMEQGLKTLTLMNHNIPPAIVYEVAPLYRLQGQLDRSKQLINRALKAHPQHIGLRIQQALNQALSNPLDDSDLEMLQLEPITTPVKRYLAALTLLKSISASKKGGFSQAIHLAQEAHQLDPMSPESSLRLVLWLLGPGGNAAQALELLNQHSSLIHVIYPSWQLEKIWALLLLARPHEADKALAQVPINELAPSDRQWYEELQVRCANGMDNLPRLEQLCRPLARNKKTQNVRQLIACAEAFLMRTRLHQAAPFLRRSKRLPDAAYLKALKALATGDVAWVIAHPALPSARRMIDPTAPGLLLAEALHRSGEYKAAIHTLQTLLPQDAESIRSRAALLRSLLAAGQEYESEAKNMLDSILAHQPTQASVIALLVNGLRSFGKSSQASLLLQRELKRSPTASSLLLAAGQMALAQKQLKKAKHFFTVLLKNDPTNIEALVELSRTEFSEGHSSAAQLHLETVLHKWPDNPEHLQLVSLALAQMKEYNKALAPGLKASTLFRQAKQPSRAIEVWLDLGRQFSSGNHWAKSRAEELFFEASKQSYPTAPAIPIFELGRNYQQKGDLSRAIWCFRQAIQRDPTYPESYLALGQALWLKHRGRKEAQTALEQYLKLKPQGNGADNVRKLLEK